MSAIFNLERQNLRRIKISNPFNSPTQIKDYYYPFNLGIYKHMPVAVFNFDAMNVAIPANDMVDVCLVDAIKLNYPNNDVGYFLIGILVPKLLENLTVNYNSVLEMMDISCDFLLQYKSAGSQYEIHKRFNSNLLKEIL